MIESPEKRKSLARNIFIFVALSIIIVPLAKFAGRKAAEVQNARDAGSRPVAGDNARTGSGDPGAEQSHVVVVASRQSARGMTDADWNEERLTALDQWTRDTMKKAIAAKLAAIGQPLPEITSESVFFETNGKKLAVTRLRANGRNFAVQIAGISDDEIVRVNCVTYDNQDVEITSPQCKGKVKEALGVSLGAPQP